MTTRRSDGRPTITPWLVRGFLRYVRVYLRRHFTAVRVARSGAPDGLADRLGDRSVLMVANHPSWWDPLLFGLVSDTLLPGRPIYGPMAADALERYAVFQRMGVYGVDESPAGARRFLATGRAILEAPRSVLWVTAEGQLTDPRQRPVRLRRGVAHLARRVPEAVVLPVAFEVGFWDERLPEALVGLGEPLSIDGSESVDGLHGRIEAALERTLDRLGRDAVSRDPERFVALLDGTRGVGGVYDLWRRLRARLAGERFDPAHGSLVKRGAP